MKKLFLMALVAMAFVACDKEDGSKEFDYTKFVYINGYQPNKTLATARGTKMFGNKQYSAKQITKLAMEDWSSIEWHMFDSLQQEWGFCFSPDQIDTANARFVMSSLYVINGDGSLNDCFISKLDGYFTYWDGSNLDTVAYIPNADIISARESIVELYNNEQYDEIYDIFFDAFVFYPCTGDEYKKLKAQGLN